MKRRVEYVEDEDGQVIAWPYCVIPNCGNGICFNLSSDFCFPHSAERLNIYPHFEWSLNLAMLVPWRVTD